jgi:hypothetical protein
MHILEVTVDVYDVCLVNVVLALNVFTFWVPCCDMSVTISA